MKELILMTAAFRIDNLVQSYDSIQQCFKTVPNVHVTWLICYDQYNAYGNIEKIISLCKEGMREFGMGWMVYNTGKEGQPNYGGDMYNDALKWLKNEWFKEDDPWVYIFDDDNIIHPAMAQNFEHISNVAENNGKTIIWLGKSQGCGTIDISYERVAFSFHTFKDGRRECLAGLPDPSQLIIKYSEIEKMGFYEAKFDYDRFLWGYLDGNFDKILFSSDWLNMSDKNYIPSQFQAYHNGQIRKDEIETIEKTKGNNTYYLVCEGNTLDDIIAHRFTIPPTIGDKCFNEMKTYAIEKGYIPDERLFKKIDRIYILTQADTPHRWNFVINQFKKLGVYDEIADKIELVKGVRIPFINQNVLELMVDNGAALDAYHDVTKNQNIGLLNCGVEHYRIMKKAIAEGYERVMIVEDDACFCKDIELLKKCLDTMPSDFGALHLEGYYLPATEEDYNTRLPFLSETKEEGKWIDYSHLRTWDTGCIIYSRKGMESYVSEQEKFFGVVDWRAAFVADSYIYSYPVVKQEDNMVLKSTINERMLDSNTNFYLKYANKDDYFSFNELC